MRLSVLSLVGALAASTDTLPVTALDPDLADYGTAVSTTSLFDLEIGNAYGKLFTTDYTPPTEFDHVVLELDFSTFGRQFDRLGHIFYNGVQIWRFSTPEPSGATITTKMTKDVSQYVELFKQPGVISLEVDNVVDSTYTGVLSVQVNAIFYSSSNTQKTSEQWYYSDAPTSFTSLQTAPIVSVPPAQEITLPQVSRNTTRLGLQIFTSGNSNEEFWYANLVNQTGPTRQIQVSINDIAAAIIDPFQPEYTGTDNPDWWIALVGVNVYDLPSYFIDISSFLPYLWGDTAALDVSIVNGFNDNSVLSNWLSNIALVAWETPGFEGVGGEQLTINGIEQPIVNQHSSNGTQVEADLVSISNYLFLSGFLIGASGETIYTEWEQSETSQNLEVQTWETLISLAYTKGSTSIKYGFESYSLGYEYPKALVDDGGATDANPFGNGGCAYSYIVQTNGITLNNTINTSNGLKNNGTTTDGYLGYKVGGQSVTKYAQTSGRQWEIQRGGPWGGLVPSWWGQAFGQFEAARNNGPALATLASNFANALFS